MTRAKWFKRPAGLSPAALTHWKRLGPALLTDERLTIDNAEKFKSLCRMLVLIEQATGEIETNGVTVRSPTGVCKPNPAVAALLQMQRETDNLLSEFGLS